MRMIVLELRAEDAEPILRKAAYEAALYGGQLDYVTRKTCDSPFHGYDDGRRAAEVAFLRAKRIVESFGIEYEPTSEAETMTVHVGVKNQKRTRRVIGGLLAYTHVEGGEPDYKNQVPEYRREVHNEACRQAAYRVIRSWRGSFAERIAA